MELLLPLTDTAISDCRAHFAEHPNTDPAISAYLTRHVNALLCAEIEAVTTRLIKERIQSGCNDSATSNFLRSLSRSAIRNAKYSEIRDTLKLLGVEYGLKFESEVGTSVGESGIETLGTAVGKRDANSHRHPPNITFRELEQVYSIATSIIEAVRVTLDN